MNMVDFGLDPQEAINIPHFMNRNTGTTDLEPPIPAVTIDFDVAALEAALDARGYDARELVQTCGLSIIQVIHDEPKKRKKSDKSHKRMKATLIGGADLRRDGTISGR